MDKQRKLFLLLPDSIKKLKFLAKSMGLSQSQYIDLLLQKQKCNY